MSFDPQVIAAELAAKRRVQDRVFDSVYPPDIRRVSAQFWTPVDVALTAALWLEASGCQQVLDVGAGAGKFCIVASLVLARTITGVEQRSHLVEIGRAAAAVYKASVDYIHGTIETIDAIRYDAFYFFNPFGENLYDPDEQLDKQVELSALRFVHDLSIVEHWLDKAPANTHLISYHGFGSLAPDSFRLVREVRKGDGHLQLWQKR
jgi:predicted RNA methylase